MSGAPRKRLAAVPDVPPDGQGRAPAASRTGKPTAADDGRAHGPYSRPPRALLGLLERARQAATDHASKPQRGGSQR